MHPPREKKFLFVCGCPRSGTTALWRLLTASPLVVLGVERFGHRIFAAEGLDPGLFEEARFFRVEDGDTFYSNLTDFAQYYEVARKRFAHARIVGDKVPKLYERLDDVEAAFPEARVVFVFRNIIDVAASYRRRAEDADDHTWRRDQGVSDAITDWTRAIAAFQQRPAGLEVLPVSFEDLLWRGVGLRALIDWVGVPLDVAIKQRFKDLRRRSIELEAGRDRGLTCDEVMEICERSPFGGFRDTLKLAREARQDTTS